MIDIEKHKVVFKAGALEIHRVGGEMVVVHRGESTRTEFWEQEESRLLIGAVLEHLEQHDETLGKLMNQVALLKQDNAVAWGRHEMANRIGAGTATMLMQAKDRIRELEAELERARKNSVNSSATS